MKTKAEKVEHDDSDDEDEEGDEDDDDDEEDDEDDEPRDLADLMGEFDDPELENPLDKMDPLYRLSLEQLISEWVKRTAQDAPQAVSALAGQLPPQLQEVAKEILK